MRAALRRAVLGLVLGVVGGGLALMIAFGRANLVASGGRGPGVIPLDHVTFAPFFLVGFALGGAVLGLFAPLRKTPLGALALGLVAAGGFVAAIFIGLAGPIELWSSSTWLVAGGATLVVGAVLGGQIQGEERVAGSG